MSYKKYRKFLYVVLLVLLGLIRCALYFNVEPSQTGKSALSFYDTEAASIEMIDNVEKTPGEGGNTGSKLVVPCGDAIGIYVKSKGVMVIAPGEVADRNGNVVSPCNNILLQGDYIISVNGEAVNDKNELIDRVKQCDGNPIDIVVSRNGEQIKCVVLPVETDKGYMLGVWVKDDISGIGTLTYIDENGFAALGHSINDNDTGELFNISDGALYKARIVNIVKPDDGKPGKLEGVIDYSKGNIIGRICGNTKSGVSGYLTKYGVDSMDTDEWIKVADEDEVGLGEAYLLTSISGEKEYYKVEIVDVDITGDNNKNIELKVVDERLLDLTGGIVQGLSGTPIIQNGKLVGAVTHVFINEPKKGYGIFIKNMIEASINE